MLPLESDTIRLFLHVLAATGWVGGQLTLAGLVGTLRGFGDTAPRTVARRFNRIAWPAFAVLLLTGIWNVIEIEVDDRSTEYQVTLFVKLLLVALSGVAALLHTMARTRVGLAVWGALGALSSVGALFFGVWLRS
ncbi:MAG TPA: CopD family protein [Acidimicrobiales bacterium]